MKIKIPTECPSCSSLLVNINGQLFCKNKSECSAQSSKLLENFCKKMKLKGFGPATLEKLDISKISELYALVLEQLEEAVGSKTAVKLEAELNEKLRGKVDFAALLASLSIPLVGEVAATKIAIKYKNFSDMTADGKAGENIKAWKESQSGVDVMSIAWEFSQARATEVTTVGTKSLGIAVCITGSLLDFRNRKDATTHLEQLGFTVRKDVTKDVQYLICEDDSKKGSSSYKKAQSLNLNILTIKQLESIL